MNNKKTTSYFLLAVLALSHATTHAVDFNASLLDPLYYSDGTTQVDSAVVSFGYFNNLSVAQVTTGVAGATANLMGYYESSFSELYRLNVSRADIVAGSLDYSVSGDAPRLLEQASGQAMWARVSAQSGSDWVNGLFVLTDTFANPDATLNWLYTDLSDSLINSFSFATKATGENSPEDFSIVSQAILGGSDTKLTLSAVTTSVAVPEPSSFSLMLLGATALVALRRLRKNV
jgi:hypothetical protein